MRYSISEIQEKDDKSVCQIIQQVGKEYGAIGEGYGPSDTEVNNMSHYYHSSQSRLYLVAKISGKVVGGRAYASI